MRLDCRDSIEKNAVHRRSGVLPPMSIRPCQSPQSRPTCSSISMVASSHPCSGSRRWLNSALTRRRRAASACRVDMT